MPRSVWEVLKENAVSVRRGQRVSIEYDCRFRYILYGHLLLASVESSLSPYGCNSLSTDSPQYRQERCGGPYQNIQRSCKSRADTSQFCLILARRCFLGRSPGSDVRWEDFS